MKKLQEIQNIIFEAGSDDIGAFGGKFEGGIQLQQIPDELAPCILEIMESGFKIGAYLEIGSAAGGSAFLIHHFFKPDHIVLVDDNKHWKSHVRPYILRDIPHIEIIGDSHANETASKVYDLGIEFDLLMIDGDHLYNSVKMDVEIYGEFLKPEGFLIFHDSQIGGHFGCAKVFDELKKDKNWEFIDEYVSEIHKPCGIGLFRKVGNEDK